MVLSLRAAPVPAPKLSGAGGLRALSPGANREVPPDLEPHGRPCGLCHTAAILGANQQIPGKANTAASRGCRYWLGQARDQQEFLQES